MAANNLSECNLKENESKNTSVVNKESNKKLSYWKGDSTEPLKSLTICQILDYCVNRFGDRTAILCYKNRKLTYDEVSKQVNELAAAFITLELKKGDHIAIWGFNSIEWCLSYLGAIRAGLVVVNINPFYEGSELKSCLLKCDVKALIMDEKINNRVFYDVLKTAIPEIAKLNNEVRINSAALPLLRTVIVISDKCYNGTYKWNNLFTLSSEEHRKKLEKLQSEIKVFDVCDIQFTSGTTSEPKGVLLTHNNLVNNAFIAGKILKWFEKHHSCCVLVPFFHAYGKVAGFLSCLCYGTTIVLPYVKFSPCKTIDCIIEEKCTFVLGTPTMYIDILTVLNDKLTKDPEIISKMSSVEVFETGGASCLPEVILQLRKHFQNSKFKIGYGMTETSPVTIMSLLDEPDDMVLSTTGHILDHTEVKVVDENNDLVPFGTPGEMCFRGYMVMKGYYKNEEKTKAVLEENGWFHSGDRFILYENGYAQIVGRFKETIIRGGENIEPKEVEEVLIKHPEIINVQVYGVSDKRLGEIVAASIIKIENSNMTENDVQKHCEGLIAPYKIPKHVMFLDNFPRTASGKIQKFKLKDMMEETLKQNT